MRPFIIFGIYLIVPFLTSFLYKKSNRKVPIIFTHLVVGILIFFYPIWMLQVDDWVNPPPPDAVRCSNPVIGVFIANIIMMIPITQVLLFLFNLAFKNKYFFQVKKEEASQ